MSSDDTRRYSNGEIAVLWQAALCNHSGICLRRLPRVFNALARPWIDMEAASTAQIVEVVEACPTGAITWEREAQAPSPVAPGPTRVEVRPGGPLIVRGEVLLKTADGVETSRQGSFAFCRCGTSGRMPWCDGTHRKIGFRD